MEEVDAAIAAMAAAGRQKWGSSWTLDRGSFFQWMGLWFRMLQWQLPNRREYWYCRNPSYGFREVMSEDRFISAWQTKQAVHRIFAATLSWVETNAFLCFNMYNPAGIQVSKRDWHRMLSDALLANPWIPAAPALAPVGEVVGAHGVMTSGTQARCVICKKKTRYKCSCLVALCSSRTGRSCVAQHVAAATAGVLPPARGAAKRRREGAET
jgi:hypothetical protein